ncbi:MAG: endolytic transglycosylase MltG [Solirubrobacterales bacterium]
MSQDWSGDPFADPNDPAAQEREQRRREREEKRRQRAEKKTRKEERQKPDEPASPAVPPPPPRTPEQEFWDEDPEPEPAQPEAAEPAEAPDTAEAAEPAEAPDTAAPPDTPRPQPGSVAIDESSERINAEQDAEFWAFEDDGDPDLAAGAGDGGRRGRREGGGARRGGVLAGLRRHPFRVAVLIVAILVLWFLYALFQPFHGDGSGKVQVKIPKGSSVSEVGDLLSEKGVIGGSYLFGAVDASTLFQMQATIEGKRSELYAGSFTLAEGMSYSAAIDALAVPPVKRTTTVTIPEGLARQQAAALVRQNEVPGNYVKKTVKSQYLDPADYGGKNAKSLEGFLFPNTFELKPKAPVADLVELQLEDFKRQIKKVKMGYAKSKNLTVYDVLIIASMVEDEAGVPEQRKLVASVIYNRLHEGMPLGIDATIRFATGNWSKPLTESELAVDSPYNTRTNQGLPPGPINSPGLAAIEAAAHPKETGFLFYVTDPKGCNELTFAKTEAEFEKAVAAYNKAREEAGGNAPSSCGE